MLGLNVSTGRLPPGDPAVERTVRSVNPGREVAVTRSQADSS